MDLRAYSSTAEQGTHKRSLICAFSSVNAGDFDFSTLRNFASKTYENPHEFNQRLSADNHWFPAGPAASGPMGFRVSGPLLRGRIQPTGLAGLGSACATLKRCSALECGSHETAANPPSGCCSGGRNERRRLVRLHWPGAGG